MAMSGEDVPTKTDSLTMRARPTRAEVDLGCIAHNVALARARVGPRVQIAAVVKADAYGHGAIPVARAALAAGADRLAVAMVEEGVALRRAGLTAPILVMGWTPAGQVADALEHELALTLVSLSDAQAAATMARRLGRRLTVHIKVDTGMGRLGLPVGNPGVMREIEGICRISDLEIEGIFTHFAVSEADREYTLRQLEDFHRLIDGLRAGSGIEFPLRHAANSGAVWGIPEAHLDMVRLGISLYGYHPAGRAGAEPGVASGPAVPEVDLRPALTWKTAVAQVKDVPAGTSVSYGCTHTTAGPDRLVTLPVGYADGYSRTLSNRGEVIIGGRRAGVVGRVCMDQIVVSVGRSAGVQVGDEVVLIGRQGDESITADEIAVWIGSISYEVLCAIGKRVPRAYRGEARPG